MFLLISVLLPLLLAPVAYNLSKKKGYNTATWFTFAVLVFSTIMLVIPSLSVSSTGQISYDESYLWSQFGNFGLRLDGLSIPFVIIIYIICTSVVLFSKPYMIKRINDFFGNQEIQNSEKDNNTNNDNKVSDVPNHVNDGKQVTNYQYALTQHSTNQVINHHMGIFLSLYLVFSMGMVGTILATNVIEFYVFFELTLIPAFFLVAFYGYSNRKRVSLMFFFWTHVGAVVLLLGLLAMGIFAGGFDFSTIKENVSKIPSTWLPLIVFSIVVGLGVKLGVLFLHMWVPKTYFESPIPIAALLAGAMSGIGIYGILRLWLDLLSVAYSEYSLCITIWGVATMIYGGAMALMQNDLRKLLAYSSISSMGYVLFGIGSESTLGISGVIMMYVAQGLGKAILFMTSGSIYLQTGTTNMAKLGGLASKMPYTATLSMIGALTMVGIPPTVGFMAEWTLFNGALQAGVSDMDSFRVALFAIAILTTVLSLAYIIWMYKKVFFGELDSKYDIIRDSNRYVITSIAVLAGLSLIIGVYPDIFFDPILDYLTSIFSNNENIQPILLAPMITGNVVEDDVNSVNITNIIPVPNIPKIEHNDGDGGN